MNTFNLEDYTEVVSLNGLCAARINNEIVKCCFNHDVCAVHDDNKFNCIGAKRRDGIDIIFISTKEYHALQTRI